MKPLEGIRVLTLEQFGAGPYSTLLLADLGADVIKIENPTVGGDAARHIGPHLLADGQSHYFQTWNMNKRSVALDLKSADGRTAFERLVATADAVVNNLRGDQPAKLKLDSLQGQVVDSLTRPNHYLYDIQPTQDMSAILRLIPVPYG